MFYLRPFNAIEFALCFCLLCVASISYSQNQLERELLNVPITVLAQESKRSGDPSRGAALFHSPSVGCNQCHRTDAIEHGLLGPNLALWNSKKNIEREKLAESITASIVDAILRPSNMIDPNYAAVRILTFDGEVISGLVDRRESDRISVRTGPKAEDLRVVSKSEIEIESKSSVSLMPGGLVNQLDSKEQFFDLVAYVDAISTGGPSIAKSITPNPNVLKPPVPEYESYLDHAGLISSWNKKSLERGRKIYSSLCVQCHGTREMEGSLPTALRFGRSKFKNGMDPYSMYKTLTHGYGLMLPQKWMVPQQKYDVIQFIREEFLKEHAPEMFVAIDSKYLSSLPKGNTRGPEPTYSEPWSEMDYGNTMFTTIEFGNDGRNIAQKAIAFRLDEGIGGVARGKVWMAFEHDTLRWAAGWQGNGFIDWRGIQFDGAHGVHPRAVGKIGFNNPTEPGWANPETGTFEDSHRVVGRDGKRYGPLPKTWGKYVGLDRSGGRDVLHYRVGDSDIRESAFAFQMENQQYLFGRSLEVGPRQNVLKMRIATLDGIVDESQVSKDHTNHISFKWHDQKQNTHRFELILLSPNPLCKWKLEDNVVCLEWLPSSESTHCRLAFGHVSPMNSSDMQRLNSLAAVSSMPIASKDALVRESPIDSFESTSRVWFEGNGWAVDEFALPFMNRWKARVRVTGLAFFPNQDTMAVCTWDGDVWKVSGLDSLNASQPRVQWQRIATGLFQPLGILVVDGDLMVTCRDQLLRLKDNNKDGVIDEYQCFNSDHQVTEHFHEFAMGLQQDSAGNFYYAKSARHALKAVVPHHGTLLRVTPDGMRTDIIATGFRAANGVCLNPDGSFVVTDQEGHWNPKNRINWVQPGKFYGNMFGYHDVTDASNNAMEQPLCWITNAFDRSPAELLWADSPTWGSLQGSLLNLSYGYGRIYVVPFEDIGGSKQGGMCQLPIPDLPTGLVRGRFSPRDGHLYVGGMFAWASSRQDQEGGLYRIRRTGQSVDLPVKLSASRSSDGLPTIHIGMSEPISKIEPTDVAHFKIKVWDLARTEKYGSNHLNERELAIQSASLSTDGKTIALTVPELKPTWGMSIDLKLRAADGRPIHRQIHNTIHQFPNP